MKRTPYLTNEELLKEFSIYWKTGKVTDKMVNYIYKIARKIANGRSYFAYVYKDEMIQEGVIRAITKGIPGFTEGKDNPFSYLSVVIDRKYMEYIKKEKKNIKIKDEARRELIVELKRTDKEIMDKCRLDNGITGFDYIDKEKLKLISLLKEYQIPENLETLEIETFEFNNRKKVLKIYCKSGVIILVKYYENGNKWREEIIINKEIQGIKKKWYKDGNLKSEMLYDNGKLIKETRYFQDEDNLNKGDKIII